MTPSNTNDTTAVQEPRHTPGPWRYEPDFGEVQGGEDYQTAIALVVDASDRYGGGLDRPTYGETAANARLFIAAPDMLEALRGLLRFASEMAYHRYGGLGREALSPDERAKVDAAVAAIKKAEGRES